MIFERFRKKRHIKKKIKISYMKLWDLEFFVQKMKAMREGFRMEYNHLKETDDAAKEYQKLLQKYDKDYASEIMKQRPDTIREILEKPNNPKYERENKAIIDTLQEQIKTRITDITQLEKQIESADEQIKQSQDGVKSYRTLIEMLYEYRRKV